MEPFRPPEEEDTSPVFAWNNIQWDRLSRILGGRFVTDEDREALAELDQSGVGDDELASAVERAIIRKKRIDDDFPARQLIVERLLKGVWIPDAAKWRELIDNACKPDIKQQVEAVLAEYPEAVEEAQKSRYITHKLGSKVVSRANWDILMQCPADHLDAAIASCPGVCVRGTKQNKKPHKKRKVAPLSKNQCLEMLRS